MSQILSIAEIQELLPQRYPFLMLDRVQLGETSQELAAIKNVTTNECQFMGHFPGNPIMPGVLQVEAMLQAGTVALKKTQSSDSTFVIKKVAKVRFKNPIIPGDQVVIDCKIDNVTEEGCDVKATCKVKGKLNSQASFSIAALNPEDLVPKSFTTSFENDVVNPESETIFNVNDIASYIPHRFPFQFIDNVIFQEDDRIIGQKLVSVNEPFAQEGLPNAQFMPNSMMLEISAQLGCVKLLAEEQHKGKIGFFLSIENTEIHRPAIPGDLLTFDVSFIYFKGSMGKAHSIISCGDETVGTMDIAFALVEPGV
ncbi:MAG: 3-hydroxyacyl-ACP dehydratase FabZ [Lentisphaeraceae bacterium]|nr:3-hydroxyacyl-ACP dehydratase FabZ [Lentisphaeraceae bacterium]